MNSRDFLCGACVRGAELVKKFLLLRGYKFYFGIYFLCNKVKSKTALRVFALVHNYQLFINSVSNKMVYDCT